VFRKNSPFSALVFSALFFSTAASASGRLVLSDHWIDFDEVEVGDSDTQTLTVENEGDSSLRILNIDLDGDDNAFSMDSSCPDELEPGESCDIDVTFEPEEYGRFRGEVEITTPEDQVEAQLEGRGVFED
jgi:hypothetical protein